MACVKNIVRPTVVMLCHMYCYMQISLVYEQSTNPVKMLCLYMHYADKTLYSKYVTFRFYLKIYNCSVFMNKKRREISTGQINIFQN